MVEHTRSVESLRAFFLVCGLLTCQIGAVVMPKYKLPRVEFDVLVLIATSGLMFLAQCRNFVLLFVALEVMSVSMYVLVAYMRHSSESLEAGLKYLVQSGISSAFLLMGIVLLYGAAGNAAFPGATDDPFDFIQLRTFVALNVGNLYVVSGVGMVLVGLLFKVAAVPFQMWVCDVYQGAPTPVTAYLGVASKAAGFVLLFSVLGGPFSPLCEGLLPLMVVVAVATVLFGNFAALGQRNVKRLMGLSGISHAGYMLMGVCAFMGGVEWAPTAVFFYLLVYLLSSFAVFSVIGCVCGEDDSSQSLDDYAGLARRDPFLASVMVVALSSLAGIPPMAGFVAKVLLFIAAFKAGLFVLAGFALLGVVVSIYYYFGWIRQIVFVPCSGEVEARSGVPTLGVGFWMRTDAHDFVYPDDLPRFLAGFPEPLAGPEGGGALHPPMLAHPDGGLQPPRRWLRTLPRRQDRSVQHPRLLAEPHRGLAAPTLASHATPQKGCYCVLSGFPLPVRGEDGGVTLPADGGAQKLLASFPALCLTFFTMPTIATPVAAAAFALAPLFTDHMVLQQDRSNQIWGCDSPGSPVVVSVDGPSCARVEVVAGADGKWSAVLPALPAGGPYSIVVDGSADEVLDDVLVGEVWLVSGQSNMEFLVSQAMQSGLEKVSAQNPRVRHFRVAQQASDSPAWDVDGEWVVAAPDTVGGFSAIGYYFGRDLAARLDVPVGIINSSWGGTRVEAWFSEAEAARHVPAEELHPTGDVEARRKLAYERYLEEARVWRLEHMPADPGNFGFARGWAGADFDDSAWGVMDLPGYWQRKGLILNGAVWFRREVEIPASWAGRDLVLSLGAVDDYDTTYFNGVCVGEVPRDAGFLPDAPQLHCSGFGCKGWACGGDGARVRRFRRWRLRLACFRDADRSCGCSFGGGLDRGGLEVPRRARHRDCTCERVRGFSGFPGGLNSPEPVLPPIQRHDQPARPIRDSRCLVVSG
jgi:NADH-quinone oxidoreductase subunit N